VRTAAAVLGSGRGLVGATRPSAGDGHRGAWLGSVRECPELHECIYVPHALDRPRFPTALPPVWNVPYRRNLLHRCIYSPSHGQDDQNDRADKEQDVTDAQRYGPMRNLHAQDVTEPRQFGGR
jgi:hypothetical protein